MFLPVKYGLTNFICSIKVIDLKDYSTFNCFFSEGSHVKTGRLNIPDQLCISIDIMIPCVSVSRDRNFLGSNLEIEKKFQIENEYTPSASKKEINSLRWSRVADIKPNRLTNTNSSKKFPRSSTEVKQYL